VNQNHGFITPTAAEFVTACLILESEQICHVRNFRAQEISQIYQSIEQRDQEGFINRVDESHIISIRKRLLLKVNKATDNGFIGLRV
jgi:hypothetical protein